MINLGDCIFWFYYQ